jgi:hypothetical protein
MTAIDNWYTAKTRYTLLETLAVTDAAASGTKFKSVAIPGWAKYARFIVDITITGTTPLFDFVVYGGLDISAGALGGPPLITTDIYALGNGWDGITQLTTDNSTPTVQVSIGPTIPVDDTGSATADCWYGVLDTLPPYFVYKYVYDGTTHDEDYNGTISLLLNA